jgi:hypothetical protein
MAPGIAVMAALGAQIADLGQKRLVDECGAAGAGGRSLDRAVPWRAVPGDLDGGTKNVTLRFAS